DLGRWAEVVDAAVPEATARDTIARHLAPRGGTGSNRACGVRRPVAGARPRVGVVSTNFVLRQTLAEACESAGYPVTAAQDWSAVPPAVPVVWDVPVLDPEWPHLMARRTRGGPLI